MPARKMTEAGMKLLREFISREAAGTLRTGYLLGGRPIAAMAFSPGDGAGRAAALKLQRDGLAEVHWAGQRCVRILLITDKGREVVAAEVAVSFHQARFMSEAYCRSAVA